MGSNGEALGKRVKARFGTAHLVAVVAGLTTAVLLLSWTRGQEDLLAVVLAADEIRAGTLIEATDLEVAEVPADPTIAAAVYSADALARLAGQVATRSISPSEPILLSDARPVAAEAGRRAMSVPMSPANAVGGDLAVGDNVDVLIVNADTTRFVAESVPVLAVPTNEASGLVSATSAWWVVLAVEDSEALEIADGVENGTVYLLRSTGAPDLTVKELTVPDEIVDPPPAAAVGG